MKKRVLCMTLFTMLLFSNTVYGFNDVLEKDWYYASVNMLKAQGVISGYSDDTFRPHNNVSYGEALKMVMLIAGIEPVTPVNNTHWASGYYSKAVSMGILPNNLSGRLSDSITRQEMATLVVHALELDTKGLDVVLNTFKDTTDKNVHILSSIGVINGVEQEYGLYFKPNNLITRAEVSAILLRVQNYKLGLSTTPEIPVGLTEDTESVSIKLHKALKDNEINFSKEPLNKAELEKVFIYMASSGTYEYTLSYNIGITRLKEQGYKDVVASAFNKVFSYYPEYFSFTNQLSYKLSGTDTKTNVTFKLLNPNFDTQTIDIMRSEFISKIESVVKGLISDGTLRNDMTEKDKAKVLYDWVALNTEYDFNFTSESYTGYGQIMNGLAVCQGYTATYNYMCKLIGLNVHGITGIAGTEHIWTVAEFDGQRVHIDVTWGDASNNTKPNYNYFGASTEYMKRTHSWDTVKYGI